MVGVALVITLPPITTLTLPIIFSVWDIIAVFKGPMVKLAMMIVQMEKTKYLFVAKIGATTIGLGDLLFYSLLAAFASTFGPNIAAQSIGLMTGGIFFTMWLLRGGKYKALPALPIPIFMGLLGIGLALVGVIIP
jgi:hypothetical protein